MRSTGNLAFLTAEQIDQRGAEDDGGSTDAPEFGCLAAHLSAGADTDEIGKYQEQHHGCNGIGASDYNITCLLLDRGWNGGDFDMNVMINNSLQFGLAQDFTAKTLKEVVGRYVRLGLIGSMDNVDEIMGLAWTPVLD